MADKFFNNTNEEQTVDSQTTENTEETSLPEAIKVGEKAYTQEELQSLVGLGEIAQQAEEKYNIKVDKVWPNLQNTINEKKELERQLQERQSQEVQTKQQTGQQLTQDEIKAEAVKQLRDLMQTPELQESLRATYIQNSGVQKLLDDSEYVLQNYAEQGLEAAKNVSVDDLLSHMANTGIKNPEKALKDMLEPEYDAWKMSQIQSLKPSGFTTIEGSTAGSKQPPQVPTPRTKDELRKAVQDFIASTQQ